MDTNSLSELQALAQEVDTFLFKPNNPVAIEVMRLAVSDYEERHQTYNAESDRYFHRLLEAVEHSPFRCARIELPDVEPEKRVIFERSRTQGPYGGPLPTVVVDGIRLRWYKHPGETRDDDLVDGAWLPMADFDAKPNSPVCIATANYEQLRDSDKLVLMAAIHDALIKTKARKLVPELEVSCLDSREQSTEKMKAERHCYFKDLVYAAGGGQFRQWKMPASIELSKDELESAWIDVTELLSKAELDAQSKEHGQADPNATLAEIAAIPQLVRQGVEIALSNAPVLKPTHSSMGDAKTLLPKPILEAQPQDGVLPSQEFMDKATAQARNLFAFLRENNWRVSRVALEGAIWKCPQKNETVRKALNRLDTCLLDFANGWKVAWNSPLDDPKAEIWMKKPGQT